MFGKRYVHDLIDRSAENPADRRRFLKSATAGAWESSVRAWPGRRLQQRLPQRKTLT